MEIPINVKVYCENELCGQTQAVIINPVTDAVTHVVIKESKTPNAERLVPISMIDESRSDKVYLHCDETTLNDMPPFQEVEYVRAVVPIYGQTYDAFYMEPNVLPERGLFKEKLERIPKNELAVKRGTPVYSSDGENIGKVDEFLVDEDEGHITHLILRKGHLWGQKEVTIPVTAIDKIKESKVRLKLTTTKIGNLPAVPVKRKWL